MSRIFSLFLLLTFTCPAFSQSISPEVISPAGNTVQGDSIQIDWTLGELAITTIQNQNLQITQGFHQPNYLITIIEEMPKEGVQIQVFPNPTSDLIEVIFDCVEVSSVETKLFDARGRLIWSRIRDEGQFKLSENLSALASGIYFLTFLIDGSELSQTYKIQKN